MRTSSTVSIPSPSHRPNDCRTKRMASDAFLLLMDHCESAPRHSSCMKIKSIPCPPPGLSEDDPSITSVYVLAPLVAASKQVPTSNRRHGSSSDLVEKNDSGTLVLQGTIRVGFHSEDCVSNEQQDRQFRSTCVARTLMDGAFKPPRCALRGYVDASISWFPKLS